MTKRAILKAGLWAVAVLVLFIAAAGSFALSFHHKFSPDPPSSDFPQPANALEAQLQGIEQFSRLLAMDRSFSPAARAEADHQIVELKSERAPLGSERFHVALLRITAIADTVIPTSTGANTVRRTSYRCESCCSLTACMSYGQKHRMRIFGAPASRASKAGQRTT
jgi:hypothetical protein